METNQALLPPTMAADLASFDAADLFGILELAQASGTVRFGSDWLRLRKGRIVKASTDPASIMTSILGTTGGSLTFRATPHLPRRGTLDKSITGLLLECACSIDNRNR